jgi:DHA2 family multidrug resistance protein-like MFS transporter
MATGIAMIVLMPESASDVWLMLAMALAGIGFGFFQTPNNRVIIGSAPRHRAGALGGLQATTRVFGQTFGAAMDASAFSLSVTVGPTLGLTVGITFASIAVLVNVIRHRQAGVSRSEG